jgi:glutaredoxin
MKCNLALLLLLCATGAQAELYKWVGPDGKVTYSDTPPPKTATQVQKKSLDGGAGGNVNLPYELAEAARNNPVTLYTTSKCAPCDDGRALLKTRGIPFSEKTVNSKDDMDRLQRAGGSSQLPVLIIGSNQRSGFEPGAWGSALSAAGYPESSRLPKNYQQPQPEPAAPVKPVAEKKAAPAESAAKPETSPASASPTAPPGFRF